MLPLMRQGRVLPGVLLLFVGGQLLLREFDVATEVSLWPVVLVVFGGWLAYERWTRRRRGWLLPLGLIAAGVVVLVRDMGGLPNGFSVWPVLLILLGAGLIVESLQQRRV